MTTSELRTANLFIIRHGQTAANAVRYVGHEDEPLDAIGRQQAEALVATLDGHPIRTVYASPLSRARDTAAPLARARGLNTVIRLELIELDFGEMRGQHKAASPVRVRRDHLRDPLTGGESLADVAARVARFVGSDVRPALRSGAHVAVVSHFWPCRVLLGTILGRSLEDMFTEVAYKPATGTVLDVTFRMETGALQLIDWRILEPVVVARVART